MKQIILILTLFISIHSFGQVPTGYQKRIVNERIQGSFMVDSAFNIPRYYDTTAANLHKRSDSCGALFFAYGIDSVYYRACNPKRWISVGSGGSNFANANLTLTGNRVHNANYKSVEINNLLGWSTINGLTSSGNYTNILQDSTFIILYGLRNGPYSSQITLRPDSIKFLPDRGKINIDSLRSTSDTTNFKPTAWNSVTGEFDKMSYWPGSGSGSINSGTTGKPAYYTASTTLDDFIAVDYATSGTNVKITTQNTTDVGLEIKGISSQSANLLNISSSGGTGDLANITKDGYGTLARLGIGGGPSREFEVYGTILTPAYITSTDVTGTRLGINHASNSGFGLYTGGVLKWSVFDYDVIAGSNPEFGVYNDAATAYALVIDGSNNFVKLGAGTTPAERLDVSGNIKSSGYINLAEIAAPSTPGAATSVIYVKSDGLFYGKDDAGVETKLSNTLSGLTQSKGVTLESPGSAENFGLWKTQVDITITSINAVVIGSSPSVTINIAFGSDITSLTNVFSSGTAITNTTTGQTINSGFNDATIPAGSWIRLKSTASSGTITQIEVTINYTQD